MNFLIDLMEKVIFVVAVVFMYIIYAIFWVPLILLHEVIKFFAGIVRELL